MTTDTTTATPEQPMRTMQVQIRAEAARVLAALAAREGSSAEALAALWLEEKAAEAQRLLQPDDQQQS